MPCSLNECRDLLLDAKNFVTRAWLRWPEVQNWGCFASAPFSRRFGLEKVPAFRFGARTDEKIECFGGRALLKLVQLLARRLCVVSVNERSLVSGVKDEPKLYGRVRNCHGFRVGRDDLPRVSSCVFGKRPSGSPLECPCECGSRARSMISNDAIIEWQGTVGFASSQHAEQDLVLSRLIIEIANNALLGEELVFRGGTCLHKLHLAKPLRYSEDLDYVRSTNTPIGPFIDQLRGCVKCLAWIHQRISDRRIGRAPRPPKLPSRRRTHGRCMPRVQPRRSRRLGPFVASQSRLSAVET